jgi:hypothetical protein
VLAATSLEWAVCDFAIWAAGLVASLMPVTSADGAIRAAASLGGPVVLKADVPGLVHRTDAGAVQLDLRTEVDIRRAYHQLTGKFGPRARVLIQPMITGGTEVCTDLRLPHLPVEVDGPAGPGRRSRRGRPHDSCGTGGTRSGW